MGLGCENRKASKCEERRRGKWTGVQERRGLIRAKGHQVWHMETYGCHTPSPIALLGTVNLTFTNSQRTC